MRPTALTVGRVLRDGNARTCDSSALDAFGQRELIAAPTAVAAVHQHLREHAPAEWPMGSAVDQAPTTLQTLHDLRDGGLLDRVGSAFSAQPRPRSPGTPAPTGETLRLVVGIHSSQLRGVTQKPWIKTTVSGRVLMTVTLGLGNWP